MSDTEVKSEDPVVNDQDDGGDDEVRDGFFSSSRYAFGHAALTTVKQGAEKKEKPLMKNLNTGRDISDEEEGR